MIKIFYIKTLKEFFYFNNLMNTSNDVIVLHVNDVNAHKNFLKNLDFKITEMGNEQFMAKINDKIVVVLHNEESNDEENSGYYKAPKGRGIELWFSVPDIKAHYQFAKNSGVNIIVDFGNRGYGKEGDYGTVSPEGFLFFFSQPD